MPRLSAVGVASGAAVGVAAGAAAGEATGVGIAAGNESAELSPLEVLKRYFGYDSFRPHQAEIIDRVVSGGDVLAVMPTSAGKSLCYQVPSLIVSGITIVVSPLVALMYDQVQNLRQLGIAAAYINSTLTGFERQEVLDSMRTGDVRLVYVAPERLDDPAFMAVCTQVSIPLVAIDEAHCISQWGNDFRPSYQRISQFIEALPKRPCVCALTATATPEVRKDIVSSLGLQDPLVVVSSFDRPNLSFAVKQFVHMDDKDAELLHFVRHRPTQSGIVYCSTRKAVDEVCSMLSRKGIPVTKYHAGLTHEERDRNQNDFVNDVKSVVVATNAFGMGIDKSNVSYVVHYNVPLSLEAYYQEAGRAGRDGMPAECLVLYSKKDVRTAQFLIEKSAEQENDMTPAQHKLKLEQDKERLKRMTFYCTTHDCLRGYIMRYFGELGPRACGNCSNCHTEFVVHDATEDAKKVISCVLRLAQRNAQAGKTTIVEILRGAKTKGVLERGYDTLSTYGIMRKDSADHVMMVLEQLCEHGYLDVTADSRPVVIETPTTRQMIKPNARFSVRVPRSADASQSATTSRVGRTPAAVHARSIAVVDDAGNTTDLFEALKVLRKQLATEAGIAPYMVFSDATLRDMCDRMPTTSKAFREVNGVGDVKAERYGKEFRACIRRFKKHE